MKLTNPGRQCRRIVRRPKSKTAMRNEVADARPARRMPPTDPFDLSLYEWVLGNGLGLEALIEEE